MTRARAQRHEPPDFSFPIITTAAMAKLVEARVPSAKVTAIVAPTGYGKTTLQTGLFHHLKANGVRGIWVALDERDTSTQNVLRRLEEALQSEPGLLHTPSAVHQSDEAIDERVDAVVETLSGLDEDVVLFLDNLNCCEDDAVRLLLSALAERTPKALRLVLASTRALPLDVARLKMQGQYTQIDYQQLALDEAQIRDVLGEALCGALRDGAAAVIREQTEGWPAAVRLVQIILDDSSDPEQALRDFSGSDTDLSEMLNRQLFERFVEGDRQFLLKTSWLRKLSVPLCEAATGDPDTDRRIGELIRRNMLIIPLDRNRLWYRLHGLFREFLVAEAERTLDDDTRREVLQRAAQWYEKEGQWAEAIDDGLQAGQLSWVADTLERVSAEFVRDRGDLHTYIAWVERLKQHDVRVGWETDYWYVWALVFHRRYEAARRQVQGLADAITDDASASDAAQRTERGRRLDVIRVTIGTYTDDLREAADAGSAWLEQSQGDDPFDVATVASACGIHKLVHFDFSGARELVRRAASSIKQADSDYGEAWVDTLANVVLMFEGDFGAAHARFETTIESARKRLGASASIVSTMSLVAARSAVETGHDEQAAHWLATGLRRAEQHGVLDTAAQGIEAAIKLWASPAGKDVSLPELREITSSYPPRLSLILSMLLTQRLLRLGRSEDALDEAAKVGIVAKNCRAHMDKLPQQPALAFLAEQTMIDLDIAHGRAKDAEARLEAASKQARDQGRWGHSTELALSAMMASLGTINAALAARHLTRAVTYAAKRGYMRPFSDRAESIAGLVNETKPQSWGFALDEERKFFADLCRQLPIANSNLVDQLEQLDVETSLLENPTPREMELLQLIEAGLSNQQLADRLSVSVATVKWHLYNLYAKLGVSSRSAAVAKARALNLLS